MSNDLDQYPGNYRCHPPLPTERNVAQVQIALLGGLSIRSADGDPIRLATRKARALLAFLALARDRIHSRDRLAAMLWGERGEAQAYDSLRHALTEIRKAAPERAAWSWIIRPSRSMPRRSSAMLRTAPRNRSTAP